MVNIWKITTHSTPSAVLSVEVQLCSISVLTPNNSGEKEAAIQKTCTLSKLISKSYPNSKLPEVKTNVQDRKGLRSSRPRVSGSRWWSGRLLNSPPPVTHWIYMTHSYISNSSSERNIKSNWVTPTCWVNEKNPHWNGTERLTINPIPGTAPHNWGKTHNSKSFSQRRERFESHIWHPNF